MPDEAAAASAIDAVIDAPDTTQNQPTNEAPSDAGQGDQTPAPEDAEQGYLRHSDYTRKTQELAQQRQEFEAQQEQATQLREIAQKAFLEQDEEAVQQFLNEIGYEEQEAADDFDAYENPEVAALKSELSEVKSFIEQQKEQAANVEKATHIDRELHRLTGEGWDTDNPDHESILARATFLSEEDGPLDIEAGYKAFQSEREAWIEQYRGGKIPAANTANLNGTPASAALPQNASLEDRANAIMQRHGL